MCGSRLPVWYCRRWVLLAVTLVAAIHTRLQGILITSVGMALFVVAMLLIPEVAERDDGVSEAPAV